MQKNTYPPYESRSVTEPLVFIALLVPTFVVLVAAVVSIASPDPSIVVQHPIVTTAVCEPCPDGAIAVQQEREVNRSLPGGTVVP